MAKDIIYKFDKTTFLRTTFGEIQSGFNISFTIDGTKDSMKVNVLSFEENEVLPYTIMYHQKTQTWWVATHDKVERYANENGFIYQHNLQLIGAVELLSARDLTDCGFNANTYTIEDFLYRLFKLSNFEFKDNISLELDNNILGKKVDYIKTFENYTLLSAIREFLDGYNMCAELLFNVGTIGIENPRYYILGATLKIIQRTGDWSLQTHNIEEFDDVRESKTINKDNYGTCVVSNAENVVSSVSKTCPSLGTIRPSGTEYNILAQNGIIRLPSNVFKANWLKLCLEIPPLEVVIKIGTYEGTVRNSDFGVATFSLNPYNIKTYEDSFIYIDDIVRQVCSLQSLQTFYSNYISARSRKDNEILDFFKKAGTITLYDGNQLNPVDGTIVKGENVPYIPNVVYNSKWIDANHPELPLIFCDKNMRDMLEHTWQGIYWERGKNIISGFNAFEAEQGAQGELVGFTPNNCDLQGQTEFLIYADANNNYVKIQHQGVNSTIHFRNSQWIVNYIPMSDIKLKVDNDRENNDVQLYNQNGRLTDGVALSKVINSYSKEISSNTITRYKTYYDFSSVPTIGSIVYKGNEIYVINNISFDFLLNENDSYFIECELTMSKYISLKSMMVNPNTNIRDYGIPQNYNVKRKQLYRDYYELDYVTNGDGNFYLAPSKIFDFYNNEPVEYVAVMRLHYSKPINNHYYYYYQLDTINYYMSKLLIIMCDFNDNNIIGYTNQNVWSGFDISRVFSGQIDSLNTPISYTDANGNVKDFDIYLENNDQLTTIYYNYQISQTGGDTYTGSLYNYSPFIPQDIYDGATQSHDIHIEENNYEKDALEVPVFEYSCQIGDNENVIVGDNILTKHPNQIVFYSFYTDTNLTQYNAITPRHLERNGYVLSLINGATIAYEDLSMEPLDFRRLEIRLYSQIEYDIEDNSYDYGTLLPIPHDKIDIAIFRHSYDVENDKETIELVFIVKNVTIDKLLYTNRLILAVNHFETK